MTQFTRFPVAIAVAVLLAGCFRSPMTDTELLGWYTYFKIQADEEQAAYEKANRSRR